MKKLFHTLRRFLSAADRKGKESVTLMVVPRNENRILNYQFSWYFIFGLGFLLLSVLVINVLLLLNWTTYKNDYLSLALERKSLLSERNGLRRDIDSLARALEKVKPELSRMCFLAQSDRKNFYNIWGVGGSSPDGSLASGIDQQETNSDPYSDMRTEVRHLGGDLTVTREVVKKMNDYIAQNRNIFEKLPVLWPLPDGGYITSSFGMREHPIRKNRREFHKGLDIAIYPGSPIVATADGTVISSGYDSQFGNNVQIMHAFGFTTRYGHCQRLKVYTGQSVRKGQVIAWVGQTGAATGYHLHYEMRIGGTAVDPWPFVLKLK
jgi:hypothetical protein